MEQYNNLLRSAYAIAQRRGVDTNWESFEKNVLNELLKQANILPCEDEQRILGATCTPLTYRIVK